MKAAQSSGKLNKWAHNYLFLRKRAIGLTRVKWVPMATSLLLIRQEKTVLLANMTKRQTLLLELGPVIPEMVHLLCAR